MPRKDINYYVSMSLDVKEDSFSESFYKELSSMTWSAAESSISEDTEDWKSIETEYREMFMLGLAILKTYKHFVGSYCLPVLIDAVDYSYSTRKSVLAMIMERLLSTHSTVTIDMLNTFSRIDKMADIYNKLSNESSFLALLQDIKVNTDMLSTYNIQKNLSQDGFEGATPNEKEYSITLWKELALSAMIIDTCYLIPFYSILNNATTGRFPNTRETIQLMYRDISVTTTYLAALASEHYQYFDSYTQFELEKWITERMERLLKESDYILAQFGAKTAIRMEMSQYVQYTLNKMLFKLGFKDKFTTTTMPIKIERSIMQDFSSARYRFAYKDPSIKLTKWAIFIRKLKRILEI